MNRQLSTFFKEQTEHLTGSTGLEHWLIESDNLPAMKALLTTHSQAVDLIYIDPPYNTGHTTLAYNDRLPSHEAWIDFMRKRLLLARQLLASDGAIFISIDQHELFRLGTLCNEIFGEKNCLGIITLVNNLKGRSDGKHFAVCNEFMLAYAINAEKIHMKLANIDEEEIDRDYQHSDGKGHYKLTGFRKTGKAWRREDRPYMYYPILWRDGQFFSIEDEEYLSIYQNGSFDDKYVEQLCYRYRQQGFLVFLPQDAHGRNGRWRWGFFDTFRKCYKTELCLNSNQTPCVKMRARLEDGSLRGKLAKTTWYKAEYDTGTASRQLTQILGRRMFDNPKSVDHIKDVLRLFDSNTTVLDFFAGSGTTLHAVLQLNAEDGGKRHCILITNNEKNICREVTLPRCQNIINGYRLPDGRIVDGLQNNCLRFFTT
jgi:adenine-specific DNA-methyltransferase